MSMNKHIIYIPHNGQENLLSQQLAYAFAKHYSNKSEYKDNNEQRPNYNSTMIIQYGSNLKPLTIVNPNDTLQIMFTPVENLNAPLHEQVKIYDLLNQIPDLVEHLIKDGFAPNNCTIQLYTLQHADQDPILIEKLVNNLIKTENNINNLIIEWHIIPKLLNLSSEQISRIFEPKITCQAVYHAIYNNNKVQIIEADNHGSNIFH